MMNEYFPEISDRRKGSDTVLKALVWLRTTGWLLLLSALLLIGTTRPELKSFFGFDAEIYVRQIWNVDLNLYSFCLQTIAFVLGCIGLVMNTMRRRRWNDLFRGSLIILVILSFLGVSRYLYLILC